jgi:hypothetical protein
MATNDVTARPMHPTLEAPMIAGEIDVANMLAATGPPMPVRRHPDILDIAEASASYRQVMVTSSKLDVLASHAQEPPAMPAYDAILALVQHLAPTWRKTQHAGLALLVRSLFERPSLCPTDRARALPSPTNRCTAGSSGAPACSTNRTSMNWPWPRAG